MRARAVRVGDSMSSQTARALRKRLTEAERVLWPVLKSLAPSHTHFRRQVAIGPYVVDFVCHAARLVIELDGGHHGKDKHMESDAKRSMFLESRGYKGNTQIIS